MRIFGINIPDDKKVAFSLRYIYGVGPTLALKVLKEAKISPDKRTKELVTEEISKLQGIIEKMTPVEGELRQIVRANIQRLKDLKVYRGNRHARKLPTRGQRTKTNSRTVRGNVRKTAGSGKRKVDLK